MRATGIGGPRSVVATGRERTRCFAAQHRLRASLQRTARMLSNRLTYGCLIVDARDDTIGEEGNFRVWRTR
jgi:hypothetical protein